jgi:excinuclease ABC subunit C
MDKHIFEKLKMLPHKPGVYLHKDNNGRVLYVGKAIDLKSRVSSYFRPDPNRSIRIQKMVDQVSNFDFIVTTNEDESLLLENNLIKEYLPKYNVRLRDDKNFLFIKIGFDTQIPTITYERKIGDKNARYFGPYTSGSSIRDTMRIIRKIFPYCSAQKIRNKPCFFYHIGKCPGVCIGKISLADYRLNLNKIIEFLDGRQNFVLRELKSAMTKYSKKKQFEKAAKIRDQIFSINKILERQKLVFTTKQDLDVFSIFSDYAAAINLFIVRSGKLIRKENFILDNAKEFAASELLAEFLPQYYLAGNIPPVIAIQEKFPYKELEQQLRKKSGRKIKFTIPERGEKRELVKLGVENAKSYLESLSEKKTLEEARLLASIKELQRVLGLKSLPGRIEAYDISNIQGTNPTGSMVVFTFGRPDKKEYRKFKITGEQRPDDFRMMRQMLERRFSHTIESTAKKNWPLPDLVLIDGGKGQLNAALSAMRAKKINLPIMGLAKRLEEIFTPNKPNPLNLPANSPALFLLQRIRDEAHRFAITYHRKLWSKSAVASLLDEIAGIGPAKKLRLLNTFGSIKKILAASHTDLARIIGSKQATLLKAKS